MLVMLVEMVLEMVVVLRWSTLLQAHSVPSFKSLEASASSPAPCILIVAAFFNPFHLSKKLLAPGIFPIVGANPETLALEASEQLTFDSLSVKMENVSNVWILMI